MATLEALPATPTSPDQRTRPPYYAGIGSRKTPPDILALMEACAYKLARYGWNLRSGGAPGADQAFERGVAQANRERNIYTGEDVPSWA